MIYTEDAFALIAFFRSEIDGGKLLELFQDLEHRFFIHSIHLGIGIIGYS